MRELKRISVAEIERDIEQPRKDFDEQGTLLLGQNIRAHGQQVPVIVYCQEVVATDKGARRYMLLDGERRWRAAQLADISELDAIVLPERPSETVLHILQMSLEAHKQGLTLMERSNLLQRIRNENNWHISELSQHLHMKQPVVSKLLAYQKLDPAVQAILHSGRLDGEKAFIISQEPDPKKQLELVNAAAKLSRDQLRQKAKTDGTVSATSAHARFPLANGLLVSVQAREVTLSGAIEAMLETARELRKMLGQGLDIQTAQRVMRDKAKSRA